MHHGSRSGAEGGAGVRATFTNEHLFLCIAALLHVLCILSCAPGASVILGRVSVTAAPYWRYLSHRGAPPAHPPLSIYISQMDLALILAAGQRDVGVAHIWDQRPSEMIKDDL